MNDPLRTLSLDCVHCGLCLTACPTYRVTGRETSSPRGRIYLMRGVAEGKVPLDGILAEEAFLCLGCRACETACPSGVEYGAMLDATRAAIESERLRGGRWVGVERLVLRHVIPHPRRLHAVVGALALAQRLHVDRAVTALLSKVPGLGEMARGLEEARRQLPLIPPASRRAALPERTPAQGERRGRVALLSGCVMPELYGDVHRASLRVLARNGFEVIVPREQRCCGALLVHRGDLDAATRLARANVEVFGALDLEAVVVNSAGCGAALRETPRWIGAEAARRQPPVRDIAELLDAAGLRPPEARLDARVCYDDPCHLVHAQGVRDAPRRLLEAIPGLELIAHADADACCGAAGIYSLTHRAMSQQVLDRKLDALEAADPDIVVSGNPGCLMQLAAGIRRRGMRARVAHPIELLDEAYSA